MCSRATPCRSRRRSTPRTSTSSAASPRRRPRWCRTCGPGSRASTTTTGCASKASASSAASWTLSAAAPDLHDRLAELEMEHATLLSELRAFEADYLRVVGVIAVQAQELEARLVALRGDRVAAAAAARRSLPSRGAQGAPAAAAGRFRETTTALRTVPVGGPPVTDDLKALFRDA